MYPENEHDLTSIRIRERAPSDCGNRKSVYAEDGGIHWPRNHCRRRCRSRILALYIPTHTSTHPSSAIYLHPHARTPHVPLCTPHTFACPNISGRMVARVNYYHRHPDVIAIIPRSSLLRTPSTFRLDLEALLDKTRQDISRID